MLFQTYGNRNHPAVLFFHAMGVTGESSEPVANYLQDRYFCILPTSTVYCKGQKYVSKADEVRQAVMKAYPSGNYPVFEGYDHMQYQIRDPRSFAEMLTYVAEHDSMPKLSFVREGENPI